MTGSGLKSVTRLSLGLVGSVVSKLAQSLLPAWLGGAALPHSHGGSRWATAGEARLLGRVADPKRPHGDGIVLGWLRRRLLQTPAEDNLLLLGVQRSGKTSTVVVPTLLGWDGAVIATSTKEELVALTGRHRAGHGPVWVFAPLDDDLTWVERLGLGASTWNPIAAAPSAAIAAEVADHFTGEGKRGTSAHWYLSAANLITALIVFEHERGGDMGTVLSRLNRTTQAEYLALASTVEDRTASELFFAFSQTPDREAGSIASTARSCLSLWIDQRVAKATESSAHELDVDQLLEQGGSLYLVAPAEEAERCRPLFSALLQTLLRRATSRARSQSGVLNPRLLLALDEAANFTRIPRLASYVSSGPGQGIQLLLGFHDLAQIESGYGQEQARTIWNNCRARLLLPGQGDLKTLSHFSQAIGDETRIYPSRHSDQRRTSLSEQRTGRPLAAVDELRRMHQAVLIYANAPPAQLELRRWDQVPAWRSLVESAAPSI
jgi:type IV secretory pathway TraG/TraD family ATPase VirD4